MSKGNINIGDKFNMLTTVKFIRTETKIYKSKNRKSGQRNCNVHFWEFVCTCGKLIVTNYLLVKRGDTSSCGCMAIKRSQENGRSTMLPFGESAKKLVLKKYIYSAKKRDKEFLLTEGEFYWIISQNCNYCNLPPSNLEYREERNGGFIYNGIDRIDSSIGYTFENCTPCCKFCNRAKKEYSVEELKDWLKFVVNNNKHLIDEGI